MESVKHSLESAGFSTFFLEKVNSTSTFLKDRYRHGHGHTFNPNLFCTAIKQTNGYGQRERSWVSNENSIKVSFGFELIDNIDSLFLRGLKLSLILREILSEFHHEKLMVKWPNDVYSSKGKVCGILTEVVQSRLTSQKYVVIGIGINTSFNPDKSSFKMDCLNNLTLTGFIKRFLPDFVELYIETKDKSVCIDGWVNYDLFETDSWVVIKSDGDDVTGIYLGISSDGFPVVNVNNRRVTYTSANISLEPKLGFGFKG